MMRRLRSWLLLLAAAFIGLQLFFVLRIAFMAWVDPESTSFQRSQAWQLATRPGKPLRWHQQWVPYGRISANLKRAVIASEDDGFTSHEGVDWEAVEMAWARNAKAEEQAARRSHPVHLVGGSTITQQLAKNLFLSGERSFVRKGQEMVLTFALEALLSKERILEIYLNSVEWGEGIFGAEAAAQHYWHKSAARLSPYEGARLAVMLPRPRYFEKVPHSAYLAHRANTILGRMREADLP